ncbi:hypothetical protein R9C00_14945 [Flammeovirgaceae bacterium SG7u.111]|nr:hypothetical protein [Flammeovirgaceae bacterium SG7u.132]WPO32998.1 hypothetical protein R9C00_14945 [Flammeovirgaceae bacterium SG7u.111]
MEYFLGFVALMIPIIAIVGGMILGYQRMKLKSNNGFDGESKRMLIELKNRVEHLEIIASDTPALDSVSKDEMQQQIDLLAGEIKKLKASS